MALREKSKQGNYFKEVPIIELYRQQKQKEKEKEEKNVEVAVKKFVEVKKKRYPCPECGEDFDTMDGLDKHKTMKHPEKYLMPDVNKWKQKRDKLLKMQTFRKKPKKRLANDTKK